MKPPYMGIIASYVSTNKRKARLYPVITWHVLLIFVLDYSSNVKFYFSPEALSGLT